MQLKEGNAYLAPWFKGAGYGQGIAHQEHKAAATSHEHSSSREVGADARSLSFLLSVPSRPTAFDGVAHN